MVDRLLWNAVAFPASYYFIFRASTAVINHYSRLADFVDVNFLNIATRKGSTRRDLRTAQHSFVSLPKDPTPAIADNAKSAHGHDDLETEAIKLGIDTLSGAVSF